ncbi:carbohydrate ABC transporter permease [Arthrobacter citreus]|uniref:carbohydrate ABC transporter permease n=1 Tax=Arthrobacter citreus TaxID=1670 RepID=UPI0031F7D44F
MSVLAKPAAGSEKSPGDRAGINAWWYLLPALLIFAAFLFYPLGRSVFLSFQGSDLFGRPSRFVGLDHYLRLFTDSGFQSVMWVTLGFTVLTVAPSILIALALALLLHQKIKAVRFFRTAFALPFAYSVATASVIFGVMFNQATGVLNGMLAFFGLDRVSWLTDPGIALLSVSIATVWMQLGYNLLVLSAGLGAVSEDVVEAARLDGAHGWRMQRSIMMPLLTPQLFFLLVTGTIHALQSFGQIHILTKGGPQDSTTTLVYSIYQQAFANNNSNFGYASAQAVVLLIIVVAVSAVQFGVLERKVFYR